MALQDQRVSEIVQGTCDHEQKIGSWIDLRGKSTHKGKAEKEVAANQSEEKSNGIKGRLEERTVQRVKGKVFEESRSDPQLHISPRDQ